LIVQDVVASEAAVSARDDDKAAILRLSVIAAVTIALTLATVPATRAGGDYAYIVLAMIAGFLALFATRIAERTSTAQAIWLIVGVAIMLRLALLVTEPLLSTDIYRYVWDGKVQAAGINPYRYVPADDAVAPLRDEAVYPNINRANYAVTIYPPAAQMFFFLVTRLGENVTAMKVALLACEAVTAGTIALLLRRLGRPVTRLIAYLWHPLPLWHIANSGHIDALMMALMMLGLWFAVIGWPVRAAVAITLGALAKPFALLALPAGWRAWDWKVPLIVVAVVVLCYAPYLSVGWGVFGYLGAGYLREERFETGGDVWPLAVWRQIAGVLPGDAFIYFVLAALVLAAMGLRAALRTPRTTDTILADVSRIILTFLFLLSPNYPWYFLIATPFVALTGGAPVWTLTIGAILLQDEMRLGFFVPLMPRKLVIYAAFLGACAYAAWPRRRDDHHAKEIA
jgi:alpha-1,6-mannosyltransferase